MRTIGNFHTHTTFCDGKNTAEEMVVAAVSQGLPALGFSGHSYTAFDTSYCMSVEGTVAYQAEIRRLQAAYGAQIAIYMGIEHEYFAENPSVGYDYVIGSVHYVKQGETYLPIDLSEETLRRGVDDLYGGNWMALAKAYYAAVADLPNKVNPDYIGHFDLLTKFNENGRCFDEANPVYRDLALAAMTALLERDALIEINTGAVYRGLRTAPYPAPWLLREVAAKRGRVVLGADSHDTLSLQYQFAEMAAWLKDNGISESWTFDGNGWNAYAL